MAGSMASLTDVDTGHDDEGPVGSSSVMITGILRSANHANLLTGQKQHKNNLTACPDSMQTLLRKSDSTKKSNPASKAFTIAIDSGTSMGNLDKQAR